MILLHNTVIRKLGLEPWWVNITTINTKYLLFFIQNGSRSWRCNEPIPIIVLKKRKWGTILSPRKLRTKSVSLRLLLLVPPLVLLDAILSFLVSSRTLVSATTGDYEKHKRPSGRRGVQIDYGGYPLFSLAVSGIIYFRTAILRERVSFGSGKCHLHQRSRRPHSSRYGLRNQKNHQQCFRPRSLWTNMIGGQQALLGTYMNISNQGRMVHPQTFPSRTYGGEVSSLLQVPLVTGTSVGVLWCSTGTLPLSRSEKWHL